MKDSIFDLDSIISGRKSREVVFVGFINSFNDFLYSVVPFLMFIIFTIVVMVFVTSFVKGLVQYFRNSSTPKETIPASLVAKRKHAMDGDGDTDAHTSYYATFETEKGNRLEFLVSSGFSGMHEEGDEGMLTYKGTRFIDFRKKQLLD